VPFQTSKTQNHKKKKMEIDQFIQQIPVVTRAYMLCSAILAAAVSFKFVSPLYLYWNWSLIKRGEYWRIGTSLCYLDEFGVNFFFLMHFIYFYWRHLEEHHYMRRTAEFLTFVVAAAFCIIVANVLFFEGAVAFLAAMLVDTVVYSWSRRFPDETLSFFGLIEFQSSYLPFVLLLWGATLRGVENLKFDIIANCIGHLLWFLADVVPHVLGVRPLAPGEFITEIFHRLGLGRRGLGAMAANEGVHLEQQNQGVAQNNGDFVADEAR
jgi:Derlin-2/3